MDRRYFLNGLGAVAASMTGAAGASQIGSVFESTAVGQSNADSSTSRVSICRVIGVGQRGCMAVLTLSRAYAGQCNPKWKPEFICVNAASEYLSGPSHVKTVSLCSYGCGAAVERARTAAWSSRTELRSLVLGADMVFLVAGLGGGMGSGVSPMLATWAREIGVHVAAAITLPFDFEGNHRLATAESAVRELQHSAGFVMQFSNEKLAQELGYDISLDDFYAAQNQRILTCMQAAMETKGRIHRA